MYQSGPSRISGNSQDYPIIDLLQFIMILRYLVYFFVIDLVYLSLLRIVKYEGRQLKFVLTCWTFGEPPADSRDRQQGAVLHWQLRERLFRPLSTIRIGSARILNK